MDVISDIFDFMAGNAYIKFLFTLAVALVIAFLAKLILKRVLKPLTRKTKTKIDDLIIKIISSIIFYLILVLGLKVGLQYFEFETALYNSLIDTFLILLISFLIFRIVHIFSVHWIKEWASKTESTADDRLIPLMEKIVKVLVVILAVIFILDAWNVNISPFLATAGIAGLAIGLAVRDSLVNILGGVQLVLDKTFKVGDKVQLESGELGVILDIGLRTTKLKTYDNEVIYIPNGYLANAKIKNYTQPDLSIRVNVNFGVVYGSNTEKVREVLLDALRKIDTVLEDPEPQVLFLKMSDFSLDFVARAWVESFALAYTTSLKMTDEIYNTLNKANIGIPFPTRTIYTRSLDVQEKRKR
ncbi:MAG: mechanosensitive ion channel family protein [Candidatus Aminicenantes bacterium]